MYSIILHLRGLLYGIKIVKGVTMLPTLKLKDVRNRSTYETLHLAEITAKSHAPTHDGVVIRIFKYPGEEKYTYRYGDERAPLGANPWVRFIRKDGQWNRTN